MVAEVADQEASETENLYRQPVQQQQQYIAPLEHQEQQYVTSQQQPPPQQQQFDQYTPINQQQVPTIRRRINTSVNTRVLPYRPVSPVGTSFGGRVDQAAALQTVGPVDSRCGDRPRGQTAHPDNCALYFNCWDEIVLLEVCPNGLLFDSVDRYCDYPENVNCQGRTQTGKYQSLLDIRYINREFRRN